MMLQSCELTLKTEKLVKWREPRSLALDDGATEIYWNRRLQQLSNKLMCMHIKLVDKAAVAYKQFSQ